MSVLFVENVKYRYIGKYFEGVDCGILCCFNL